MRINIDVSSIKGKQGKLGVSNTKLASQLGICRNTLATYYKTPGKMPFGIMVAISEELEINVEEARTIFFHEKLS